MKTSTSHQVSLVEAHTWVFEFLKDHGADELIMASLDLIYDQASRADEWHAMRLHIATEAMKPLIQRASTDSPKQIARFAYRMADAMIKERT